MSLSFGRDKRLLKSRQFSTVFDSPSGKAPGKCVLLLVRENGLDHPRIGLVIGKKAVRLAVERNRIKRIARDSFRRHQDLLGGVDIVMIARKGLGELENSELHRQFEKLWKRLMRQRPRPESRQEPADAGTADA